MRLKASFSAVAVLAVLSVSNLEFGRLVQPFAHGSGHPGPEDYCVPGSHLVEKFHYYEFFGAGAKEADRSFRQRLLVNQDFTGRTKRFAGQATWHIDWQPCLQPMGMLCRIGGVSSNVHVTYTLPGWVDRAIAGHRIGTRWDSYGTNLLAHEKGHGRIALKVAHMIEREVTGLVDLRGCEAVKAEAARIVTRIMREGEAMQNDYDRVTGHGNLQGARFPF